jgi:hypothetical protein
MVAPDQRETKLQAVRDTPQLNKNISNAVVAK